MLPNLNQTVVGALSDSLSRTLASNPLGCLSSAI